MSSEPWPHHETLNDGVFLRTPTVVRLMAWTVPAIATHLYLVQEARRVSSFLAGPFFGAGRDPGCVSLRLV